MTTAARPTWAPAKGGNEQGGTRIFGPSQKYSSRDIAAHTTLKPRKEGQDTQDELQRRNLRDELEDRERRHFSSKEDRERRKGGHLLLEVIRRDIEDRIIPRSVDADDADVEAQTDDSEDDEDDDDGDDEEALLAELERLRREKAEQKEREDDEDDDDGDDEEALLAELERLRREKAEQKERENHEPLNEPAHELAFELEPRKEGQDTQDELQRRNLRDELEDRERRHFSSKEDRERRKGGHLLLEGARRDIEDRIIPRIVDADDADVEAQTDDSEDDEDDDDGDDEEALLAELERLRREKAEQKEREEREMQEEELKAKEEQLMRGNPLLNNPTSFTVKRRWDDDVVFKNQARGETKTPKRFINDTIRSDFHRKFLHKYMK
ncbi:hypothetical protein CASFOL_040496 [Castilleja foliolosa]|uniref:Uncharacterized protein n=1 Tax=Castilleja foliolosa TaxID=1961234 RepID=A0ABD3BBT7_9LAMI